MSHTILSASSSHRWLHCPPSARLAEQLPNEGSPYAAAGTLTHALAELKARKYFLEPMSTRTYNTRVKKLKADPAWDPGMDAATDLYLEHLKEIAMRFDAPPFVALESRVDYSNVAPEGFGTADCLMISRHNLYVVDYKNGAGVDVPAEHNSQLMLYALGALHTYGIIFGDNIRTIHLHIVQPRAGGVKTWSLRRQELQDWGENVVKPAATLAYAGKGDFCPGEWCDSAFCPARARCAARARALLTLEAEAAGQEPALLTDAQLGDALTRALALEKWVKSLKEHAEKTLLGGGLVPGFKLVEGRSSREWTNTDEALRTIQERGVPEAVLWKREPVSVAGLEKALGKAAFAEAADGLWEKKPGRPTLAPESDKRPAYNSAEIAFGHAE